MCSDHIRFSWSVELIVLESDLLIQFVYNLIVRIWLGAEYGLREEVTGLRERSGYANRFCIRSWFY